MFSGDDRVTIATDWPRDKVESKIQEYLEPLGSVDFSEGGRLAIAPRTSLVSAFSILSVTGTLRPTDNGFKLQIDYTVSPSPLCWVLAVLLFCFSILGGGLILVPLILDKPNVARIVESALRDLKETVGVKRRD